MFQIPLDEQKLKAAVFGGAVLGGGGGGKIDEGMKLGRFALEMGEPKLVSIEEMQADDLVATVSMVGAPAATQAYVKPIHYIRALQLLIDATEKPIRALITNENGAGTTINGWLQSAALGIPVLDAPCNGRAHPTGSMGAMNLSELEDYQSIQAVAGGKGKRYLEFCSSGSVDSVSTLVRTASIQAGGLVAVARNPISVDYVKKNGAVGAISQAIKVGETLLAHASGRAIQKVAEYLGGEVVTSGEVYQFSLETTGGFDVGNVKVGDVEMTFWNEYMTLEVKGERIATFPDLIMTFDSETGRPIPSAELTKGMHITILSVPKEQIKLGSTMSNPKLFEPIEKMIEKPVLSYVFS